MYKRKGSDDSKIIFCLTWPVLSGRTRKDQQRKSRMKEEKRDNKEINTAKINVESVIYGLKRIEKNHGKNLKKKTKCPL